MIILLSIKRLLTNA